MTPPRPGRPRLNAFTRRLIALLEKSSKTQKEIAEDLGYPRPNIVTMFKTGTTRVPIEKVPPLAFSTGADPADLVRLWLFDYEPELLAVIDRELDIPITQNEKAWVIGLRDAFSHGVPTYDDDAKAAVRMLALKRKLDSEGDA